MYRAKEDSRDIEIAVYLMDETWRTIMVDISIDTTEDNSEIGLHWIPSLEED